MIGGARPGRIRARAVVLWLLGVALLAGLTACTVRDQHPGRSAPPPAAAQAAAWTVAENGKQGTDSWKIPVDRVSGERELAGYADKASVLPGEPFDVFVTSRLGEVTLRAFRIGSYGGHGAVARP